MVGNMSKKTGIDALSRRGFLGSVAAFGAATWAGGALAQDALDDIINAPRRGTWDDQFDAKASRSATAVVSNTPIFGMDTLANTQNAIGQYQQIVSAGGWPQVNSPVRLEMGVSDPSVQALRQRLIISGDLPRSAGISNSFDSYVDGAVKRFQARHGLPSDGVLGEYSVKALNIAADVRLGQLNTNIVRLQSMSGDLGERYVLVNIPAAYIEAVENGRVATRHTAVVGRISRQTHIINSKIYEIILNPILDGSALDRRKGHRSADAARIPTYLERNNSIRLHGWQVARKCAPADGGLESREKAPNLMFRQDPGKNNAMSSTKINFHNPNNEYMHDTPQQGLFNKLDAL